MRKGFRPREQDRSKPSVGGERRASVRFNCNLPATVKVGGAEVGKCVVKDLSSGGARLLLQNGNWMPGNFFLVFEDGRETAPVRLVWSDKETMGVEFFQMSSV